MVVSNSYTEARVTSPGLARLRANPNAEAIRQQTVADQQRAREQVAAKPPKPTGRPRRSPADAAVIVVQVAKNPKRGKAKERFALYRSGGMTIGAYKAAVGDREQADRDILWDLRKGFIRVVAPRT